jgi:hypothetical protein
LPETAGAARRRCSWSVDHVLGLFDPPTWGWFATAYQILEEEPWAVLLADHGVLAQRPRELLGRGDGRIAGLQPPDDFDQAHQHDGVEKMQADDAVSGVR